LHCCLCLPAAPLCSRSKSGCAYKHAANRTTPPAGFARRRLSFPWPESRLASLMTPPRDRTLKEGPVWWGRLALAARHSWRPGARP
jgi:hypothetical protein